MDSNSLEEMTHPETLAEIKVQLKENGITISRPFWAFAQSNDCEQFWFFYLDEGTEDPHVYSFDYFLDGPNIIRDLKMTFSQLIEKQIDVAIEDLKWN